MYHKFHVAYVGKIIVCILQTLSCGVSNSTILINIPNKSCQDIQIPECVTEERRDNLAHLSQKPRNK
jgi:hypothetical protein